MARIAKTTVTPSKKASPKANEAINEVVTAPTPEEFAAAVEKKRPTKVKVLTTKEQFYESLEKLFENVRVMYDRKMVTAEELRPIVEKYL